MSVKTKIRSLIAAANAKTGNQYADLTTAVQSLIKGYGVVVEQISFTINIPEESEVNTFSAVSGTTWKEWVGTGRPVSTISGLTLYCFSDDGIVFGDEAGVYALALDGTWVHGNDTITSGAAYTIDHYGG